MAEVNNEQEYYIGQIFEDDYPPEANLWCMDNNARIMEIDPIEKEVDGETVVVHRFEIQVIPDLTVDEKKMLVRQTRDGYIGDIEWRVSRYRDQVELKLTPTDTEEVYISILEYMQYLRDYPESSETWYEQNPLTFDEWIAE